MALPKIILGNNDDAVEILVAQMAHERLGVASPNTLIQLLAEYGFKARLLP